MNKKKKNPQPLFRILDANFNRLKEGTRVCEDLFRFICKDAKYSRALKKIRHEATQIMLTLPVSYRDMVMARDTRRDPGKYLNIPDQSRKIQVKDLAIKNFKRAEESLRVLEEIMSLISNKHILKFQKLRFKLYAIEKRVLQTF